MLKEMMAYISGFDPEVGAVIEREYNRQRRNIELIASENCVSVPVLLAAGSVLTNKYAEGYPGNRYYGGCEEVDVRALAIERAKALRRGPTWAPFRRSGQLRLHGLTQPGDTSSA